jgi:4-amino-4-deoxy-L-arabinose transferase-like glycosyltransferase
MASAADTNPVPPVASVPSASVEDAGGASPLLLTLARVGPFAIWAVVILGAFLSRPPTAPIELETLSTAWHMLQTGSWAPLLNGEIAATTPPLHDWLILVGWQVFGVSEAWPRLLSALAALAALFLVGTSARTLWPHRATTQIFARILMAGLGGFIVTASMIAPEVIALPIELAGFQAICMLRQNRDGGLLRRAGLWLLFTMCVTADLFMVGWTALLLLPPIALLAPHLRDALGDPAARPRGWRRVQWRIAVVVGTTAAVVLACLWLSLATRGRAVGLDDFLRFGFGWTNSNSEATRYAPWTLILTPMLLFPWIVWKTLWRALARQTRDGYGFGFRLCLIFLASAIVSGIASGVQLQGMMPIGAPLALIGARLLANQAIKPKDFHAVVPGFIALMLGLFFFLMNMIPTAHLDALWRQFFGVALPIWLGGSGLTSGIVLFVGGYILAQMSPARQMSRTLQVACIPVLLITCANIEFPNSLGAFFDLKPIGSKMRELQDAGQEIAVYGPYRGEYDFYGRLTAAPKVLLSEADALAWAKTHPRGAIVTRFDGSALDLPALPYFRGVARDRWVAIWPTSTVLDTDGAALAPTF